MEITDHALLGTALAIALGIVKILEKTIEWAAKKMNGGREPGRIVELGSEPTRMIRETYEHSKRVDDIISVRDHDGIPMAYTPRSTLEYQLKTAEALRDMSKDTVSGQEQITKKIDEILAEIKKRS